MSNRILLVIILQTLSIGSVYAQYDPTEAEVEFQNGWIRNTSKASSDEDVLIAAMFSHQNQPPAAPEFLQTEFASVEQNQMRLSIAYYYCRDNKSDDFCLTDSFAENLITIDPDNLEPYLYLMVDLLDAGKDDEALAALRKGNAAKMANSYYRDKVNILRTRLQETDYPAGRINWASEQVTDALQTYFFYVKLMTICKEKSPLSVDWKAQCLELGRKLETSASTVVQNVYGFGIQRDVLGDSAEEQETKADVIERMAAFNHIRDVANERLDWVKDVTLKPEIVYSDTNEFGEIEAISRAISRTE